MSRCGRQRDRAARLTVSAAPASSVNHPVSVPMVMPPKLALLSVRLSSTVVAWLARSKQRRAHREARWSAERRRSTGRSLRPPPWMPISTRRLRHVRLPESAACGGDLPGAPQWRRQRNGAVRLPAKTTRGSLTCTPGTCSTAPSWRAPFGPRRSPPGTLPTAGSLTLTASRRGEIAIPQVAGAMSAQSIAASALQRASRWLAAA